MKKIGIAHIVFFFCLAGASAQGEPVSAGTPVSVSAVTFPVSESVPESAWIAPSPAEKALLGNLVLDDRDSAGNAKIAKISLGAGMAAGLVLAAVGVGKAFSAASDGLDAIAMHEGFVMVISGSLVSSIFSMAAEAAGITSQE